MRIRVIETVGFGGLAAIYFTQCNRLLFWTVDWITSTFSLEVGPVLAAVWIAGEVILLLMPFVLIRMWATRFDRSGLFATLGALAAFWLPVFISGLAALAFGVPVPPYGGIGGSLTTWLAFVTDMVASVLGLGVVLWSRHPSETALHPAAAH